MSYSEWNAVFETIAADKYWRKVAADKLCVHILPAQEVNSIKVETSGDDGLRTTDHQEKRFAAVVKRGARKSIKVEEIIISDSDGPSVSSTEDEVPNIRVSVDSMGERQTSRRREVVNPPVFIIDEKETLSEFLKIFEEYFRK